MARALGASFQETRGALGQLREQGAKKGLSSASVRPEIQAIDENPESDGLASIQGASLGDPSVRQSEPS